MSQITVRATEDLVFRVKQRATAEGKSMNEFVTMVLEVATNPANAGTATERLRERLARAGLLADLPPYQGVRPEAAAVERAAREAAGGRPLSDYVSDIR